MDPAESFLGFIVVLCVASFASWGLVAFIEWVEANFG